MKSTTAFTTDIFDDNWERQTFLVPGLTPGFKLEPLFPWEFPASSGRASQLPAAKAIPKISPTHKKLSQLIRSENL
ncbi:MAG: hypothetical protein LBB26_03015 [Puniceicoccales bacterium]|nr:hypothetical protein [Puniceicoccales bacterium]